MIKNQLFIKNLETKESYLKLKESNLEKYSLYGRVKLSQNEKNIFYKNLDNKKFSLGLNRLKLFLQNKKTKLKKLLK